MGFRRDGWLVKEGACGRECVFPPLCQVGEPLCAEASRAHLEGRDLPHGVGNLPFSERRRSCVHSSHD